jgi:hypothetical protein
MNKKRRRERTATIFYYRSSSLKLPLSRRAKKMAFGSRSQMTTENYYFSESVFL